MSPAGGPKCDFPTTWVTTPWPWVVFQLSNLHEEIQASVSYAIGRETSRRLVQKQLSLIPHDALLCDTTQERERPQYQPMSL